MAYKNTETGQIGTLYKLLPNVSNPFKLTEEQLGDLNIVKHVPEAPPEPSLEELKYSKNEHIKKELDNITKEGCDISLGFKIDFETHNRTEFALGLQLINETGLESMTIRDFDNVNHIITAAEYKQMVLEMAAQFNKLLAEKWTLNKAVEDATTKEEVEAIYWRKALYSDAEQMIVSGYEYNPILGRGE